MMTPGHSPVFIISETHLMGFELRNEKLENFQEDEEVDLEQRAEVSQLSEGLHMAAHVQVTLR